MSISKASLLNEIREAVAKKKTETGERNAVVRVLAKHGAYKTPKIETGRFGKGSSLRIYIWDTKWGTLVLSSGPSVEGEVQYADKRQLKDAPEGSYHVLEKATGTSKITNAMKKIAAREAVTGSTTVSKPKRKKAAPKKKAVTKKKAAPKKSFEAAKKSFEAQAKKEKKQVKHLIDTLEDTYWNVRQGEPANVFDVPARLDELAKLLGSEAYISLTPRRTQEVNNNTYEALVMELPQIRSIAETNAATRRGKAQRDAEAAAETKAYSLVKDFKERGSTGYLKDVLKMYHGDDEYESRAARSAINDFAQYAVPGVRIQESMDVFANAAEGKLNDEKIASYYIENRADVNQITDNQILRLVEGEPELDDAPDNRLSAMAEDAYLDDAVEDYYQAMKTRHGDEALFLGHTNDDPARFERGIKTKLSQDDLESDNTESLGRRFYGLVKDREVSELFAELNGILDEEKLTNVKVNNAEVHVERLNELFDDDNFQRYSVKGSMRGRLEAAEQRLAERKAEVEANNLRIASGAETMSEADEVAEMMQQLQAIIAAKK